MAAIPKTYDQFKQLLDSVVYAPSARFLQPNDYVNYANMAVIATANELGGIHYIDRSITTVAAQSDYPTPTEMRKIKSALLIRGSGATVQKSIIEVISSPRDEMFLGAQVVIGDPTGVGLPAYTPGNADRPKFLAFWPEAATLRLVGTPQVAGDTLELYCLGTPSLLATGVVYSGDSQESLAIVYKMASLARLKSRETGEASWFDSAFQAECDRIRRFRSKQRQVRRVQDGRFRMSNLRSFDSAK